MGKGDMAVAEKNKTKGLGRGLDALLGDSPSEAARPRGTPGKSTLPIEYLQPNPDQPRKSFNAGAIDELAKSITARGLLAPILVRPKGVNLYEIVAGERRWRAAQKASLHEVPVVIRELTDDQTAEIALIENIQRVDLSPLEEAQGYQGLIDTHGRSHGEIAKAVGKSRSHVANFVRLLSLPPRSREALVSGEISMGHARALLTAKDADSLCVIVIAKNLSVRETEALARGDKPGAPAASLAPPATPSKNKKKHGLKDADTRALERDLATLLGLEVEIAHSKKGAGSVTINYLSLDQLDDICRRLMGAGV